MKKVILGALLLIFIFANAQTNYANSLEQGIEAFNATNYTAAETHFKSELKNPNNASVANFYLGLIEVARKNDEKAAAYFESALSAAPNYARPYPELMKTYFRLGKIDEAIKTVENANAQSIVLQGLHFESGRIYRAAGKEDQAMVSFRKERTVDARFMWASLYVAILQAEQERYEEAFSAIRLVEQHDTNKFNTAMITLMIHEMKGDTKAAEELLKTSERLFREKASFSAYYDYNLAWLYHKQGDLEKAVREVENNISKKIRPEQQYYNMARIYADLGRFEEATLWVKKIVYDNPDARLSLVTDPVFKKYVASESYQSIDKTTLLIDDYPYNVFRRNELIHNIERDGALLVPVFSSSSTPVNIFQRLGIQFDFNPSTMVITGEKGWDKLVIDMKKSENTLNGKATANKTRSRIQNDVVYVPIELIAEVFGYQIEKDERLKVYNLHSFKDVPKNAWYYDYLGFTASKGIVRGFADNTFRANNDVTVDQFIVMTLNAIGVRDIQNAQGYWAQSFIDRAIALKIIEPGQFISYTAPITRVEAASIINKAMKLTAPRTQRELTAKIDDLHLIPVAKQQDVINVFGSGIITLSSGATGTYNPQGTVPRAAAVAIFSRVIDASRRVNVH